MNLEHMDRAIALLASVPEKKFDLRVWRGRRNSDAPHAGTNHIPDLPDAKLTGECGTVACIAGWVAVLAPPDEHWSPGRRARAFLGLDAYQADALFEPPTIDRSKVTIYDAIEALTKLRDTGVVDWSHCQS